MNEVNSFRMNKSLFQAPSKFLLFILILFGSGESMWGQPSQVYPQALLECGTDQLPQHAVDSPVMDTSCFNLQYVLDNCVPVYIRTTVHLFADDNCDGRVRLSPTKEYDSDGNWTGNYINEDVTQVDGLQQAEDLIDNMNAFNEAIGRNHEWYNDIVPVDPADQSGPQCFPVRYVLDDVIIHCDSDRQSNSFTTVDDYTDDFGSGSQYDIFIYELTSTGSSTPSGASYLREASHNSGSFSPANHVHEAGHSFGCKHTFTPGDDGCADTWNPGWSWNGCEGNEARSSDVSCRWTISSSDDRCDDECAIPHPCCGWDFQTNNVMSYSGFGDWPGEYKEDGSWKNGANMTACQMELQLWTIRDHLCDIVYDDQIGSPCPPVAANIGALPTSDGGLECPPCFYLGTSDNEYQHQLVLMDESGNQLFNSGNIINEAGQFCLNATQDKDGNWHWPYELTSGQSYTLLLSVQNECGDSDTETHNFSLGNPHCYISTPVTPSLVLGLIAPNPSNGMITVDLDVVSAGNLSVYGVHTYSQTEYGAIHCEYKQAGPQSVQIDISNWQSGPNTLIFELDGHIIGQQITKL